MDEAIDVTMRRKREERLEARVDWFMGKLRLLPPLLLALAVGIVIGKFKEASAQDKKPKNPLCQPDPIETGQRLKISYLAEVSRGSEVTLVLMSGVRVTGRLLNVKTEHDVVVLETKGESGQLVGCYKAVAIAGVEWSPK